MPTYLEWVLSVAPSLDALFGVRRIDEQHRSGDAAQCRQVEDASTRLRPDAEIVRNYQQRARVLHG